MSQGLSGSNGSIDGQNTANMQLIESRVTNELLLALLGTSQVGSDDGLGRLRNDQAFELEIPTPLPGAGR